MKRIIVSLLILLQFCPAALAQGDPLAGITIQDGWMTGTVTAHFDAGTENETLREIKVDCPVPAAAYPNEILTVSKGYVSKKQMQQALKAAGQSTKGRFQNKRGSAYYMGDWNAKADADISKEDAAAQAVDIALRYFDALGVEVMRTPTYVDRPYDYDAYMEQQISSYGHKFSDPTTFINRAKANWKRRSKYNPKQTTYTRVEFDIMLDGMRLWSHPSYPAGYTDEPDAWEGCSVSAYAIVSDSGVLVEAYCDLYEIKSRRTPKEDELERFGTLLYSHMQTIIPAASWQDALSAALADSSRIGMISGGSDEQPYQNKEMAEPITAYGSQSVITGIYPCLSTISRDEWAAFWTIECKQEYADGWRN